jgi:pilus assembly protein TadC
MRKFFSFCNNYIDTVILRDNLDLRTIVLFRYLPFILIATFLGIWPKYIVWYSIQLWLRSPLVVQWFLVILVVIIALYFIGSSMYFKLFINWLKNNVGP